MPDGVNNSFGKKVQNHIFLNVQRDGQICIAWVVTSQLQRQM